MICNYCFLLIPISRLCMQWCCHDLKMLSVNISDTVIITVKNVDYRCIIDIISKSVAIKFLKNFILENRGYI